MLIYCKIWDEAGRFACVEYMMYVFGVASGMRSHYVAGCHGALVQCASLSGAD